MALALTDATLNSLAQAAIEPNIVLKIDGVPTLFVANFVKKYDASGNLVDIFDQNDLITLDGTSTSIKQTLNVDKGEGSSISTVSIALMDDGFATRLITPGEIVDDILMRQAKVYMGFGGGFPDDFVVIFRGLITDIVADSGKVILQLNHSDDKKRTNIFKSVETKLTTAMTAAQTTIPVESTVNFLRKKDYPTNVFDSSFESYVRIDDEVIRYESISAAGEFQGVTRGQFGTVSASHDEGATVTSFYRLKGNGIDLALKIMSSGTRGLPADNPIGPLPSHTDVKVTSINLGGSERFDNAIYFEGVDLFEDYGLLPGDWLHVLTGSSVAANQVSFKKISEIVEGKEGDFLIIEDVAFLDEVDSDLKCSFVSQFATLPDGCRFRMDEIDVAEHLRLYRLFLNSVEYDFFIKDGIDDARDFLEKQIYAPMSAYSLPRKARASLGYHIGPIPGTNLITFDPQNIKNPNRIQLKRSTNKNFFNEIVYKFDEDPLEDKFLTGYIIISESSKNRIKNAPNRTMTIEGRGMRTELSADNIALIHGRRKIKRYEFGAETVTFEAFIGSSFSVEIGDVIIFDGSDLFIPDIKTGAKGMEPRFFEVVNKDLQLKTGDVKFEVIDTKFDGSARYGLIGPASKIASGISRTRFVIESSYASAYGPSEYKKWKPLKKVSVRVRTANFSQSADTVIQNTDSNTITVSPELPFDPVAGMILELSSYADADTTEQVKLVYCHMKNSAFADGKTQFQML